MDLKANHSCSPVITDPIPTSTSRLSLSYGSMVYPMVPTGYPSHGLFFSNNPKKKSLPGKIKTAEPPASNWIGIDVMLASSPRKKLNKDFGVYDVEQAFRTWTLKYPSALNSFERIAAAAKDKKIALFLDYDGTLSPIVANPDNAVMSEEMRMAVKDAAKHFPTAIISGRSRDKVLEFVKLTELYYAGSHGMDILGPARKSEQINHSSADRQGEEVNLFQPAREFLLMMREAFSSLAEGIMGIDGARMEDNKFCISVHYRNVERKDYERLYDLVNEILKDFPRLRLTHGRMVLEVRPVIEWNKGKAVEFLLESLGLTGEDVLPIYIGDDKTDEDAFKVLREGKRGLGILVSSAPKETDAFYSLKDPNEVMEFLQVLVNWKEEFPS